MKPLLFQMKGCQVGAIDAILLSGCCQPVFKFSFLSITVLSVLSMIAYLCALPNLSMESYDVCLYPIVLAGNLSFYAGRWCAEQEEQQKTPTS